MTTSSAISQMADAPIATAAELLEAPEPLIERIGIDDPTTAHGGRRHRTAGPLLLPGLIQRVRTPAPLRTEVRRIPVSPT